MENSNTCTHDWTPKGGKGNNCYGGTTAFSVCFRCETLRELEMNVLGTVGNAEYTNVSMEIEYGLISQ